MNNDLTLFNKILFLDLRPWKNRSFTDDKFKTLFDKLQKVHFSFQPLYELTFPKPLTAKRKYYQLLIDSEVIQYLNNLYSIITSATNESEKFYWLHSTLTKVLVQKFKEVSKTINDNQYFLDSLNSKLKDKNIDSKTQDEIYIIQLLKAQLIRMYLEIQNGFTKLLTFDALSENEILELYFTDPSPDKSYLIDAANLNLNLNLVPATTLYKDKPSNVQFKAITDDIRKAKKGILDYKTIIKNPERFASIEEQLFNEDLIDLNYNFNDKHGQKQLMAAIYQKLIMKGYFNKKAFQPLKDIKHVDIRKFLDHRYNTNLDKQFRTWGNSPTELADFVEKTFWIDNLPVC